MLDSLFSAASTISQATALNFCCCNESSAAKRTCALCLIASKACCTSFTDVYCPASFDSISSSNVSGPSTLVLGCNSARISPAGLAKGAKRACFTRLRRISRTCCLSKRNQCSSSCSSIRSCSSESACTRASSCSAGSSSTFSIFDVAGSCTTRSMRMLSRTVHAPWLKMCWKKLLASEEVRLATSNFWNESTRLPQSSHAALFTCGFGGNGLPVVFRLVAALVALKGGGALTSLGSLAEPLGASLSSSLGLDKTNVPTTMIGASGGTSASAFRNTRVTC
mmetsp:Transcript_18622/g.41542  ORF Transcript_18622/g.41542 Transcript_18622/m.41542 type:complete len:280 (-) Transcript_18622:49-888(-)